MPVATTLKVTLIPVITVWDRGWVVMAGALATGSPGTGVGGTPNADPIIPTAARTWRHKHTNDRGMVARFTMA